LREAVGLAIFLLLSVVSGGNAAVCYVDGSPGRLDIAFAGAMAVADRDASVSGAGVKWVAAANSSGTGERWAAPDKLKHAGYSFAGTLAGASVLGSLGMAEGDRGVWAGASVLCVGLFKEIAMDRGNPGSVASWRDAVANLVGVVAAGVAWELAED
jgi:hypothetical protein